eukprot:1481671-Rhodomonas_salina.2
MSGACYAMSGTDVGYAFTRPAARYSVTDPGEAPLPAYARATRCAVLLTAVAYGATHCLSAIRAAYGMSGTEVGYGATAGGVPCGGAALLRARTLRLLAGLP